MEKEKKKMGRPVINNRNKSLQLRMSEDELNTLKECSEKLKISRTDVIAKGINLIKKELENRRKNE